MTGLGRASQSSLESCAPDRESECLPEVACVLLGDWQTVFYYARVARLMQMESPSWPPGVIKVGHLVAGSTCSRQESMCSNPLRGRAPCGFLADSGLLLPKTRVACDFFKNARALKVAVRQQ
jgi:hypothetical protein